VSCVKGTRYFAMLFAGVDPGEGLPALHRIAKARQQRTFCYLKGGISGFATAWLATQC
jgi:hypothetical protein